LGCNRANGWEQDEEGRKNGAGELHCGWVRVVSLNGRGNKM
jgi:hypothetical protein